ncbi:uncharacterized protein LOC131662827 isoform X2 [Phymastichus coffea]|uniref:uncharacterized protein LOC131662827 isoform X2 n=1 Tax=Phymastichus coffea TaxID=108790 RepID=UPI00273C83FC|nr:uncharacterized protein LOC131662827 isoform X2 [Phymastichus coffea]
MSTKAGLSNISSNNNNNNSDNNHMSAKRAGGIGLRMSESSLGSATAISTNVNQSQQHVVDKSAVKRKKRRKDEEKAEIAVVERVPMVLLTRLEDGKKSNERKTKQISDIKVVIERTDNIESIKTLLSEKLVPVGKKNTRHLVHRSSENFAGSDAKTLEPIGEKKAVIIEKKKKETVTEDKKKEIVIEDKKNEIVIDKKNEVVVEIKKVVIEKNIKTLSKKSIVYIKNSDQTEKRCNTAKIDQTENKSYKAKSDQKPVYSSVECNVHNVNNDYLNQIDPKIIERQLLVTLDRSQVENFLKGKCLQRLQRNEELVVEINKNHSESKTRNSDVFSKASKEIKTCAIPSDAGVADETEIQNNLDKQPSADNVMNKVEKIQQNTEESVKIEIKNRGRSRMIKKEEKTTKRVVKSQRLSSREKKKVESQSITSKSNKDDSDKDLRDNTKINKVSSVQINENQIEHVDESSKDTSCESAKINEVVSRHSLSKSKSFHKSAVVNDDKNSSKKFNQDKVNNKIIESNSINDDSIANGNSYIVTAPELVPLQMEVNAIPHDNIVLDDSNAENNAVQKIYDIHSKNLTENTKFLFERPETVESIKIYSESAQQLAENSEDSRSSEFRIKKLINCDDSECPVKNIEENVISELSSVNVIASETFELPAKNSVNDNDTVLPNVNFMSCGNAESTNDEQIRSENNESLIETIEDTESTTSTCTLIEETPEELSRNLDKEFETEEELSENTDNQPEVNNELVQNERKETEAFKELPQVAEKDIGSLNSTASVDVENVSQEDKGTENNEHESTFENNLKSVENLVIDSILNGEIVSPKIIAQSATNRVEEVQTFVFESGVEDFVNDIEVPKEVPTTLESLTPIVENPEPSPIIEESSVVESLGPLVSAEEPTHVENSGLSVPVEKSMDEKMLPLKPSLTVEHTIVEESSKFFSAVEKSSTEKTLESTPATEEPTLNETSMLVNESIDEEFVKHRRKHTLSELKKKCTENIDKRQVEELEKTCNSIDHEQPLPANIFNENHTDNISAKVSPNVLSPECYLEPTVITNKGYFENISDSESDICLSDRLRRLTSLEIPSFEDASYAERSVQSEDDEISQDHTKRQRILMKITKTDANKHVTHLVESKEQEEVVSSEQAIAEQVTEGGNSARIPGYSPTSSDLSSGNSSCRVPSCSPAKPDSGSYRMPGWSPASTEIGQTTIKKKQGRPKKYPIFTDAELIAKTTAIVNNVDVHTGKLMEKPLFEPVESIRINEDDEVENNEEHQTVITNQMCLSGTQLLDAMPTQPEILTKFAKEVAKEQTLQKKNKKVGRLRKKPFNDSIIGTEVTARVKENVTVARVAFNVVDSIEELVEPVTQINSVEILMTQTSPMKKKGIEQSCKVPLQNDRVMLATFIDKDFSLTEDEAVDEDSDDKPYSERLKVENRLHEGRQLSKNQTAEDAYATTEDEDYHDSFEQIANYQRTRRSHNIINKVRFFNEIYPKSVDDNSEITQVKRNEQKPKKNLQDISILSTEEDNSMTENEDINDSFFTELKVKKRGRKPWKHLKNKITLQDSEASVTNEKQSSKHLNNDSTLSENQVTEGETSMTENESINDAPSIKQKVERRGRKPWRHLKNITALQDGEVLGLQENQSNKNSNSDCTLSGNQVKKKETSITEREDISVASSIKQKVKRRGRKPWKHLKNIIAIQDGEVLAAQENQSIKHSNDNSALSENQVTEKEISMTENESMSDISLTELKEKKNRGHKSWRYLNAVPEGEKRKRGRPRKYPLVKSALLKNQTIVEKLNSKMENEVVCDTSVDKQIVRNQDELSESLQDNDIPSSENVATNEAKLVVENVAVNNTFIDESVKKGRQSFTLTQNYNSFSVDPLMKGTENEIIDGTSVTEVIIKKKRGRQSLKKVQDTSETNLMTEDESAHNILEEPFIEKQQPSKHLDNERASSEDQITKNEHSTIENLDANTFLNKPKEKKKRGRKPWKHLINQIAFPISDDLVKEKMAKGGSFKNSVNSNVLLANQIIEETSSITKDEFVNDTSTVQSITEEKVRSRTPSQDNACTVEKNLVTEDKAINESSVNESLVEKNRVKAQTEDETVSSTEDISTVDRVVQKKRVRFSINISEESLSLTEDETVSSTEDISKVDQPVVKRKPGRPRTKHLQTNGMPLVPSFRLASRMMEPPVVKKRGRTLKKLPQGNNSLLNSTTPIVITEDETVSSTEDIPIAESRNAQKDMVGIMPAPTIEEDMTESLAVNSFKNQSILEESASKKQLNVSHLLCQEKCTFESENSSLAASSMEDLSTVVIPKKRGRKPRVVRDYNAYSDSLAASSMEDLSAVQSIHSVGPKKRGRKPRIKIQQPGSVCTSSMEDLSTLSPKKRRGRPPKNLSSIKIVLPKDSIANKTQNIVVGNVSIGSIQGFSPVKQLSPVTKHRHYPPTSEDDNITPKLLEQVAATLYQSTFDNDQPLYDRSVTSLSPIKKKRRRGRPPKYPREEIDAIDTEEPQSDSLSTSDKSQSQEKRRGRLPRKLSQGENILSDIIDRGVQSNKNDANKPGHLPRRLSYDSGVLATPVFLQSQKRSQAEDVPAIPSLGKRQGRPPRKFSPDEEHSFSVLPQLNHDGDVASTHVKRQGRPPRKYSHDDGMPLSQSSISDSDETIAVKKRGRKPKKLISDDGTNTSPVKRKPGRSPRFPHDDSSSQFSQLAVSDTENVSDHMNKKGRILANLLQADKMPSIPSIPLLSLPSISDNNNLQVRTLTSKASQVGVTTISTTNLLRQQRKPKMSQPSQTPIPVSPLVITSVTNSMTQPESIPPISSVKRRGRPAKLSVFEAALSQSQKQEIRLPGNMTAEQLRQRRHSQDDSMFSEELPKFFKERPKEFEDAQPKRKRGRPRVRELPQFVIKPLKPQSVVASTQTVSSDESSVIKEVPKSRVGRPCKVSPDKGIAVIPKSRDNRTSELTVADYLRTWTDRDESPSSQTAKKSVHQRRFSQDDSTFVAGSRSPSRNRSRRYSQGDTLEGSSDDDLRTSKSKRIRSSSSDDSLIQDEKRPRVEKELCDQHSITKELVVQLTKIDKADESPAEPIREIVKMNLRRKLEGNSNGDPPPLVPIEPKIQPPTHSDAKLLMLMQPTDDKALLQTQPPHLQPPPQQFCIIFIPDALTSAESALNKDSQPTATIVNFQPVPDSELANKSVIYTPTTPTKIFVNEDQHNRSFLCTTCTQALDLIGRLEANVGMTEEDKCAIKCPFCSNDFQSLFYLEYHLRQEHLKCENEKQCRHSGFNTLRIPSHDVSSESEIYITFALKCRSCYELFENVFTLNEHVKIKHASLMRHKPPLSQFSTTGMVCYPPPPFKNGTRTEVLHCPSDCICRIGIRSTDSPMQRAQVLKRCPNFMRRLEKIEAAAYEVYTCTLCKSTFLMKDEVVEHLMKMHEVSCKFPCTKCLTSFRAVQMQENHHCSETTIRDLDKLINIVILPTDKAHDNSKFEDSSNDELGPIKTTPPPAVPSASTPLNGLKRKNGVVIQRLSKYLAMQPPKKPRLDSSATSVTTKKRMKKTPCPKCQKKFAYRKSLNDHIIFEHIIPCKADEASKNMAVELLRLVNNGGSDAAKIEELASALGKYTDDDGVSLKKLTMVNDEQENWNDDSYGDKDLLQCFKCKANFKSTANSANLSKRNNQQSTDLPAPQLCERCDSTRRHRNTVKNGYNLNIKPSTNGELERQQQPQVRYTYECDRCGDSFPTSIELNRHKNDEHSNKPSESLKCDICSKIFYSSRMLEKHKKMHHDDSLSNSRIEDESMECSNQSVSDMSKDSEANDTTNSSTSRRDSSDNKEEEKCKCPHCEFSAEKVSLKNHLKREHGVMAFICQFCGKLLVEISEVRHMLDYHIKSSRKNGNVGSEKSQDDVSELLKTLGKKRLQSLMIYHDFEGKCNNAIMRCPICPEQFATRESCRHHYQWMHDSTCILCDASFSGGNVAGQHKVAVHNSIASYVWAIQRLVSAIVHNLKLDRVHPSHVLYQEVSLRLDMLEEESNVVPEGELPVARINNNKTGTEEVVSEPFLEPVVLSEDQLPGSGNMIEVVIGNDMVVEDSEDNLLENFYLSPNYESSCEQPKILDAGAPIPELEEEEEVVTTTVSMATATCTVALPTTPSITTSNGGILIPTTPVTAETYATSAVFKLRQDNGQEEVVLAITDEDLVTYRDDIGSLAERLSATCDSLSLEEITTMLRSYFENVGTPPTEEIELANAIEPRTQ